jgi:hypothetical protein
MAGCFYFFLLKSHKFGLQIGVENAFSKNIMPYTVEFIDDDNDLLQYCGMSTWLQARFLPQIYQILIIVIIVQCINVC